ncbi:DEAD/DEAH box helicase, partial [Methanocalculus sp.]|uniref:DEAD/DEAH box helicase n=1 Tax=Methanocalculus sp. TaxID=2004547 RepID=UPI0027168A8E
ILAPTAGGKTESGFIPALDDLLKAGTDGVGILYLSPLKALINDQIDRISRIAAPLALLVSAWHGDIGRSDRAWREGEAPHILLTTPESLEVLLTDPIRRDDLKNLRSVIIDEVHAFITTDRGVHLRCLLDRLDRVADRRVRRIGLSATIGNPDQLLAWLSDPSRPQSLVRAPSSPSGRRFSFTLESDEDERIRSVSRAVAGKKALVFVGSRTGAERIHAGLSGRISPVFVHHSAISSDLRHEAEERMAGHGSACIICTSTLELGIDIGGLDLVIQFGPPDSAASFLQRLGRTGRRGSPSEMAFILASEDDTLVAAAALEAAREHEAESLYPPALPCHVFVQQLFLLLRAGRAVGRRPLIEAVRRLTPFEGISESDCDQILDHLLANGYLVMDGDLVAIGPTAERELSWSHWIALCSVISGGNGYRAVTPDGQVVGTLDPCFIEVAAVEGFTLAGRGWRVISRDDARRGLLVVPSDRQGPRPFWTGGGTPGLSLLLAQSVGRIAERGGSDLPLPQEIRDAIAKAIYSWPEGIGPGRVTVISEPLVEGTLVSVWTFLGDRPNATVTHLLRHLLPPRWPVQYDAYAVSVTVPPGEDGRQTVYDALLHCSTLKKEDLVDWMPILPPETWAFGRLLPEEIRRKMAAVDIFAIPGILAALKGLRPL